jgi:hypothetical protein
MSPFTSRVSIVGGIIMSIRVIVMVVIPPRGVRIVAPCRGNRDIAAAAGDKDAETAED